MMMMIHTLQRLASTIFYTPARLASTEEVQCLFPMSPLDEGSTEASYLWNVSISNDNLTFSNAFIVVVYDSKCLDCRESGDCSLKVWQINYFITITNI